MLEKIYTNTSPGDGGDSLSIPLAAYSSTQVDQNEIQIALAHNGTIDTYTENVSNEDTSSVLLKFFQQVAQSQQFKVIASSFQSNHLDKDQMMSKLWLQEDIVPYAIKSQDESFGASLAEQVGGIASHFDTDNIVYPQIGPHQEVEVAELVSLDDYRRTTSPEDFARLCDLAQAFRGKKVVFINATPRGGGVALMRHALIRLLCLLDVDAHWHVLMPKKEAFDVTKMYFHNVLQAVATPDTELTQTDKEIYESWIHENALVLEKVFREADVIVIDDPQPAGLIPFIKEVNPGVKVIYRSHIQIVASLASQPGTPQYTTWRFLWQYIQQSDYFVSHPMRMFVPDTVPSEKIFYMPATTDPLDGLNKPLTEEQMKYYMQLFNALLRETKQLPLDETRPYIVQIARFDPSKGIPDVLEAYWKLRTRLEEEGHVIPQLVIAGNGSIDDPDGVPIYNRVIEMLASEPYVRFASDVKVARLPHWDQVLNTLMRKSTVALQLSIKEGFEVKVTEALMKGKPVIAYNVGGIPLQIKDGTTGYLVDVHNTAQVAQHLYALFTDTDLYQRMSSAAIEFVNTDYLTVSNAICWLYLALTLVNDEPQEGCYQWVKPLAESSVL
jgi:alpha,alpha-trehalose phosphorylase (configuration-retaining)